MDIKDAYESLGAFKSFEFCFVVTKLLKLNKFSFY